MDLIGWFRRARPATQATVDPGPIADAPIRTAAEDVLRRSDFAERIAATVSAVGGAEQGRVYAIRGGWGFGKSSLKNLVIERLGTGASRAHWLEFNPWQWGDADAIARALFLQMADRLGGVHSSGAAKRAARLRRYGDVLTGSGAKLKEAGSSTAAISTVLTSASVVAAASAVGFSLPSAAAVAMGLGILSFATPIAGGALKHLGRDRSAEPLDAIRRSLEESLRGLDRPLVVFVDDIDRLEPDQIRLLFRQVKVNANLPNIVFVMLFQPSIVERALDPIANGEGRAFLEKIVQTNFDLPAVPDSTVHRVFTELLSAVAGDLATEANGFERVRWGNVLIGCVQPHVRNLRDARRLASSIAVHLPLHRGVGAFEVNMIDFVALETLRVFEPDLHDAMFASRSLLLQARRFAQDGRDQANREAVEALVALVPEAKRPTARDVLRELFPRIGHLLGGNHFGGDWDERWLSSKRVCTSRFFDRYFQLQTPEGQVSESEFVSFLDATGDPVVLSALIESFRRRRLLPSLAARMDESVGRLPKERASTLLPVMFSIGQELSPNLSGDPYNSPWVSAWRAVSWYVDGLPPADRGMLALTALRTSRALSVGSILIHLNDPADRRDGSEERRPPSFAPAELAALKAEWLRQIRELATTEDMLRQDDLVSHLYRWRDYTESFEEPRAWVSTAIRHEAGFVALMSRFMSRGVAQGWGDRVGTPHDTFSRANLEDLVDLPTVRERVERVEIELLDDRERHVIDVLKTHLRQWKMADDREDANPTEPPPPPT